ncbi:hypothetical protein M231_07943 [Tremella mesenterica]|uniref:Uncharacterized protein n=1 Tax=Tremella mesenterica TaxID=5217 RepID=A0A4Q1B7Y2_TREME|nr:hypothetical protein M231_07943 [Tremella mesenterica]
MRTLEKRVSNPVKRYLRHYDSVAVGNAFTINHEARHAAEDNGTFRTKLIEDPATFRLGRLATAVAIGYGDASSPHLNPHDSTSVYTISAQFSGQPRYIRFPQLNVDVLISPGDILLTTTGSLIHHAHGCEELDRSRITAVLYTQCVVDGDTCKEAIEEANGSIVDLPTGEA